jgi:hypothetical protein
MVGDKQILFIRTAGRLGGGSLVVSIPLFLIGVVEHLKDHNVTASWMIAVAALLVCFGSYKAWSVIYDRLEAETAKNSKPDFQMDAVRAVKLVRKSGSVGPPSLLISSSVVNLVDAPSTIRSISLSLNALETKFASRAALFGCQTLVTYTSKRVYPPGYEGEAWINKENEEPIVDMFTLVSKQALERGKHVEGWLLFDGLAWSDLETVTKISFHLSVKDAFGLDHNTQPFNLALEMGAW